MMMLVLMMMRTLSFQREYDRNDDSSDNKAFASVDRNIIWQLMHHYGIPSKFIKLIQDLYESSSCQVIHNGKLSESFEMITGARQGCLLSPMIFIMVCRLDDERGGGSG